MARAPADGYTLLQVATPHAINVTLYDKSPVNVMSDIVPIAGANSDSFVMMVPAAFPAKTVPELIAYAKANPGKVNVASAGTANLTHLSAELFRMRTGIDWVHVLFRGSCGGLLDLDDDRLNALQHERSQVAALPENRRSREFHGILAL